MRKVLLLLLPILWSCTEERFWVESHKEGLTRSQKEYYLDGDDSIFTYQQYFYESGQISVEGPLKENERDGQWRSFFPEGEKWSETSFKQGKSHGPTVSFYENGKTRYIGAYSEGEKSGEWIWYDSTGVEIKKANF